MVIHVCNAGPEAGEGLGVSGGALGGVGGADVGAVAEPLQRRVGRRRRSVVAQHWPHVAVRRRFHLSTWKRWRRKIRSLHRRKSCGTMVLKRIE